MILTRQMDLDFEQYGIATGVGILTSIDDKNNPEVIECLIKRSRYFSFDTKMAMCRDIAHLIDNIFPVENSKVPRHTNIYQIYKNCYLHELEFLSLVFLSTPEVKGLSLKDLTTNDFRKFVNLYKSYCPPFVHNNDERLAKMENDHCQEWDTVKSVFFTRMGLLQFKHQVHEFIHLYRYHWFFTFKSDKIDMEQIILNRYGSNFDDYVLFAVAFFCYSMNCNEHIITQNVLLCFQEFNFSYEKTKDMISNLSATREEYNKRYTELKSSDKRLMIYNFNPLRQAPLICMDGDDKEIFLPIPQFLFCSITKGFYHTLCYERSGFRKRFGKEIFEKYVQHVLTWKEPDFTIITEFNYKIGKQELASPDIILVRGNDIIMMEIKATAPTVKLGVSDVEDYVKQLAKAYGVALGQCIVKEKHVRNGYLTHPNLPSAVANVYYVIVTLEEFYMFYSKFFHEQIKQAVKKEKYVELPDNKVYHLMGINSLERIIENETRPFFDYIIERELSGRAFSSLACADTNNILAFGETRSGRYLKEIVDDIKENNRVLS